jgi:GTP pyrophosphokinase
MVSATRNQLPLDCDGWLAALGRPWSDSAERTLRAAHALAATDSPDPTTFQRALATSQLLADLAPDHELVAVPLLSLAMRGGALSETDVPTTFGPGMARLIGDVVRLQRFGNLEPAPGESVRPEQLEGLRKLLLYAVEDLRVVLVRLAERLADLRDLKAAPAEYQQRVARETLDIYAPLANRLGIGQLKWELEDLALRYLEPDTYRELAALVEDRRSDREHYIGRLVERISHELQARRIAADVYGRAKHLYSILRKMRRKRVPFQEVFDVRAVRVLVDDVSDCYGALGVVHALWSPIGREFDDYIANPKENGYQSLHTAVIGPQGRTVEIQIRTREMNANSELGVAAHWRYKEGGGTRREDLKVAWLRRLLEVREEDDDGDDLFARLQAEAMEDRVYVLTPKGEVIDLPAGATPLDFAYKVHTDLGHRCRGAKVDGHIVPLANELHSGERVELLTARQGGPSRDWLNPNLGYLKSPRARSKIRQWFRQADHANNSQAGRAAVDRELTRLGLRNVSLQKIADRLRAESVDALMAAVGFGDVTLGQVVGAAQPELRESQPSPELAPRLKPHSEELTGGHVRVQGVGNLMTHLAKCCHPVPPEPIVGYITLGRGVSIHRQDCSSLLNLSARHPQRMVEVQWGGPVATTYPVELWVSAWDRTGLLRDVTTLLAAEKVNVVAVQTRSDKRSSQARMELTVEISDLQQLSRLLDKLTRLRNVIEAGRKA